MSTWVLTKGMNTLRGEFNKLAPGRDKASDGSVGDLAHQEEAASGHNPDITGRSEYKDGDSKNEVRAIDVDSDLRTPGLTMEIVVQHLVALGRAGKLAKWVKYLIYNRRIWSASDGWKTRTYTGPSAHTEHLHVSGAYSQTADENTNGAVYEFERIPVALTSDDKKWLTAEITRIVDERADQTPKDVWGYDPGVTDKKTGSIWPGVSDATYPKSATSNGTVGPGTALSSVLSRGAAQDGVIADLKETVSDVAGKVSEILSNVKAPTAK